jgi:hypothetical protein
VAHMSCVVLGAMLAFIQAPSAVSPKVPDSTTARSHRTTKNLKSDKVPPAQSPTSVGPSTANHQEQPCISQKSEDSQQAVRIRELPPVSILKDWADWGIWVFTGLLVGVGFLQWRVIRTQANLMGVHAEHLQTLAVAASDNAKAASDGAEAAKTNAEAYMVSQRAELIALLRTEISLFLTDSGPIVPIDIRNNGPTPAYHCTYETWIEVLDVPFQDFTQAARY